MYTILVVDDNPSIVDIFVNMLQQGGYMTLTATSGEKALQILEKNRPDIILLDIMMEPLDGWQTLERIKAGPPSISSIPVMMITAKQLTIEEAVRMITLAPAVAWGFADRGLVREGMRADLNVFDPATVGPAVPHVVHDLPAGGRRLVQKAVGFKATVVNGEISIDNGVHTGTTAGRLLRNALATR